MSSLARRQPARGRLALSGVVLSLILLAIGALAPLMTTTKLFIFSNTISLATGIQQLFQQGHWLLGLIVFGFSLVFPIFKAGMLVVLWQTETSDIRGFQRRLHWLAATGKWSMLDVFVVALLLVSVKLGALASVEVHYGLYAFAASVLLSMLVTSLTLQAAKRASDSAA